MPKRGPNPAGLPQESLWNVQCVRMYVVCCMSVARLRDKLAVDTWLRTWLFAVVLPAQPLHAFRASTQQLTKLLALQFVLRDLVTAIRR